MGDEAGATPDLAQLVAPEGEPPGGGDGGILLPQRPGRGVAGVDVGAQARLDLRGVEPLELGDGHVDLAAHLDHLGRPGGQPRRQHLDGGHVGGHVLAGPPVAAGGGLHQAAALVADGHGQPVDLQLAHQPHLGRRVAQLGQAPLQPIAPGPQLVGRDGVVERHHGHGVHDGGEGRRPPATDDLGGRVGRDQFGELGLERLELAHERVPLGVGDLGLVELVVALVVVADGGAQLVDPGTRIDRRGLRAARCDPTEACDARTRAKPLIDDAYDGEARPQGGSPTGGPASHAPTERRTPMAWSWSRSARRLENSSTCSAWVTPWR